MFGKSWSPWERQFDRDLNDFVWRRERPRGTPLSPRYNETEGYPEHGEPFTDFEYPNGSTWRIRPDGSKDKIK